MLPAGEENEGALPMPPARPRRWPALPATLLVAALAAAQQPAAQPPPSGTQAQPQPGMPAVGAPKAPEWPKTLGGRTAADWVAEFHNPDPTLRENAVKVLPAFGPDVRKVATKPLIGLIDDPDPGVRVNAILVLATIGFGPDQREEARAAAAALASAINKTAPGSVIRLHAARALATLGTEAVSAVPTLARIAEDPSWETRAAVATALGRLGAPVYGLVKDPNPAKPPVPKHKPNRDAMDKLAKTLLADKSGTVRMEAVQGLLQIGPPYVEDPNKYGEAIEPYVKIVTARLKTDAQSEREPAVRVWLLTLHAMYDDRTMDPTVDKLAGYLQEKDPELRVQSLNALTLIGPRAKGALPQVRECLKAAELPVVTNAVEAMLAIGEEHRTTAILEIERQMNATPNKDLRAFYESVAKALRAGKKDFEQKAPEPKKP
jgi:HEAT repeat protein